MSTQHMFSWRNKKNIMWIPLLSVAMNVYSNLDSLFGLQQQMNDRNHSMMQFWYLEFSTQSRYSSRLAVCDKPENGIFVECPISYINSSLSSPSVLFWFDTPM